MTGNEFKKIRISSLGVSRAQLAILMETPLSTIRDIETVYARQEIRGCYKRLLELLVERDRWVMATIKANLEATLDRRYPNGIPSEIVPDDEE